MTLVEVLVSMAIIASTVGAATTAVLTMTSGSTRGNESARVNVIATGFAETIKILPYHDCNSGDLVALYTADYDAYEAALPANERLIAPGATGQSVEILAAEAVGSCPPDPGVQRIEYRVTVGERVRTAQVEKRDPDYDSRLVASGDASSLFSTPGDSLGVIALNGTWSEPQVDIIQYEWNCGPDANEVAPLVFTTPDDGAGQCTFPAQAAPFTPQGMTLTVTDLYGRTAVDNTILVEIPAYTVPRPPPVAVIAASCPASPCTGGAADLNVTFNGTGSYAPDGSIVSYLWDFDDPLSGDANVSTQAVDTHSFRRQVNYVVTLTVTDDLGRTDTATHQLAVTVSGPPRPIAAFTRSPDPAVAPAVIVFNGTSSRDAFNQPVVTYAWDFGDGQFGSGATPSHTYNAAGTYPVRLTVTAANSATAYTVQNVVISPFNSPFAAPSNFRFTGATSGSPWPWGYDGTARFAWTNVAAAAGDRITYQVEVTWAWGLAVVCGGSSTVNFPAGAVGTTQTGTVSINRYSYSLICDFWTLFGAREYIWRVRAQRVTPANETYWSPWSPNQSWRR